MTVELHGSEADSESTFDGAALAGNKVMVNHNFLRMFGSGPATQRVVLLEEANVGDSSITVEAGLDDDYWGAAGSVIHLAPTGFDYWESDYRTIEGYDSATGVLTLNETLSYYHWGGADDTSSSYQDKFDIRGKVTLLTRNVRVVGAPDPDAVDGDYGGHLVTADYEDDEGLAYIGVTQLDNVEFEQMGQKGTTNAAIRFEDSTEVVADEPKYVRECVFHNGWAWGMSFKSSSDIEVTDCSVIGFRAIGVSVHGSEDIEIDNLLTSDVITFDGITDDTTEVTEWACVTIGAYFSPNDDALSGVVIKNSISAGCKFAGFIAPGHECGATNENFFDNVAHSVSAMGARIYPHGDGSQSACYQGSLFSAHHCGEHGVIAHDASDEIRFTDMVFADNVLGIMLIAAEESLVKFDTIHIYGETDMPTSSCPDRLGFMATTTEGASKPLMPTAAEDLPIWRIDADVPWNALTTEYTNLFFHDFAQVMTHCPDAL